jgi:hypothetical protein
MRRFFRKHILRLFVLSLCISLFSLFGIGCAQPGLLDVRINAPANLTEALNGAKTALSGDGFALIVYFKNPKGWTIPNAETWKNTAPTNQTNKWLTKDVGGLRYILVTDGDSNQGTILKVVMRLSDAWIQKLVSSGIRISINSSENIDTGSLSGLMFYAVIELYKEEASGNTSRTLCLPATSSYKDFSSKTTEDIDLTDASSVCTQKPETRKPIDGDGN